MTLMNPIKFLSHPNQCNFFDSETGEGNGVQRSPLEKFIATLEAKPLLPAFSAQTLDFIHALSKQLLKDPRCKAFPELVALGFWLRKANLQKLLQQQGFDALFDTKRNNPHSINDRTNAGNATSPQFIQNRAPLGLAVHFTPANVDTMFIYSWVAALLLGNNNIVRVASKDSELQSLLLSIISMLFAMPEHAAIADRNYFIHFDKQGDSTALLCSHADARLIWGGDQSVAAILAHMAKADCVDLCFADKFSAAIVANVDENNLSHIAQLLWRDTQPYLQQACSSPRILYFVQTNIGLKESSFDDDDRQSNAFKNGSSNDDDRQSIAFKNGSSNDDDRQSNAFKNGASNDDERQSSTFNNSRDIVTCDEDQTTLQKYQSKLLLRQLLAKLNDFAKEQTKSGWHTISQANEHLVTAQQLMASSAQVVGTPVTLSSNAIAPTEKAKAPKAVKVPEKEPAELLMHASVAGLKVEHIRDHMLELHTGNGFFLCKICTSLDEVFEDIAKLNNTKLQTLSYANLEPDILRKQKQQKSIMGIDRIVPLGQALDFSFQWDGYDLLHELSRPETSQAKVAAVIFGAGDAGRAAYELLQNEFEIVAFVDNDSSKHGTDLLGLRVISPDDIESTRAAKVLIASEYSEQIVIQVAQMGLKQEIDVLASRYLKALDFSRPNIREQATQALLALCTALNKTDVRYYIDAGTLLGMVRDGGLIPWDDDLDIAIHADDLALLQLYLPHILADMKHSMGELYKVTTHISQSAFGAVQKGDVRSLKMTPVEVKSNMPMIDLFVKYIDGENMDYCLASRGIRMPAYHFNTYDELVFRQQIIKLPHQHKAYLSAHYGDWQTPKPEWSLSDLDNSTLF